MPRRLARQLVSDRKERRELPLPIDPLGILTLDVKAQDDEAIILPRLESVLDDITADEP